MYKRQLRMVVIEREIVRESIKEKRNSVRMTIRKRDRYIERK